MPSAQHQREKLVGLLTQLFQLDQPDLDFGFYRIMHAKAAQVTAFLESDLLKIVETTFGQASGDKVAQVQKGYEDAVAAAKSFGAPDPEQTEPVKKARAALDAARDTTRAEGEVYDHLYRFFERYYEGGDFLSRRYFARETPGKAAPYAVPYDGSEVYLHWANKDQYYIKTAEYFTNFTFDPTKAPEVQQRTDKETLFGKAEAAPLRVNFRIVSATEGEHGNVKASDTTKRYFILHDADPVAFENDELICRFEYRPDPDKTGQEGTWQAKRNAEAVEGILKALEKLVAGGTGSAAPVKARAKAYLAVLKTAAPTEKQKDRPILARYVNQYAARNTTDYFIHKNLRGFLKRELDFYIKNEIIRLDDIESADAPKVESYLAQVRCLRAIAGKIIDFIAQLEDFQKSLWLKKKFITETYWCISIGTILAIEDTKVRDDLLKTIAECQPQWDEWETLHHLMELQKSKDANLFDRKLKLPSVDFLRANPSLMIDTRRFPPPFTIGLLAQLPEVDKHLDVTMIHGDNFQVLSLALHRYRGQIKCTYIDPPYNSKTSEIAYKNSYKHSSWLSLMGSRLQLSARLATGDGTHVVAIDENEQEVLGQLLRTVFPLNTHICIALIHNKKGIQGDHFSYNHEYAFFSISPGLTETHGRPVPEADWEYDNLRKWGRESERNTARNCFYPIVVKGDAIVEFGEVCSEDFHPGVANIRKGGAVWVYPVDSQNIERKWRYARNTVEGILNLLKVHVIEETGEIQIHKAKAEKAIKTVWDDSRYIAGDYGTKWLTDLGVKLSDELYPKSVHTVEDSVLAVSDESSYILDYFGGSGTTGHAVVNLNRLDQGRRKCLLVELGDHFNTVLVPRMKKIAFTPEWKDGSPKRLATAEEVARGPRVYKMLRLESYEDCLNNLELKDDAERRKFIEQAPGLREDYMLHYMLDVETRGSASLLNIDQFKDPTAYKLKVKKPGSDEYDWKNVDLIETFNYLIGLRVEHYAAPQTFTAQFEREVDADLPKGQLGRLKIKGKLKPDAKGAWWFRKLEGWVPKNAATPNDGAKEKVLIVWRKLTDDIEQDNLVLDEWFRKHQINPREQYDYDTIYVNGSNNLPNLKLDGETWRVRLIEEDFHRLMWDTQDL